MCGTGKLVAAFLGKLSRHMGSRLVGGWYHELLQVWDVYVCGRESLLGLLGSCRMKITRSKRVLWELEKSGCCICSI